MTYGCAFMELDHAKRVQFVAYVFHSCRSPRAQILTLGFKSNRSQLFHSDFVTTAPKARGARAPEKLPLQSYS